MNEEEKDSDLLKFIAEKKKAIFFYFMVGAITTPLVVVFRIFTTGGPPVIYWTGILAMMISCNFLAIALVKMLNLRLFMRAVNFSNRVRPFMDKDNELIDRR